MKRLFVDTSGWMALADAKDPLHVKSRNYRDKWFEDDGILVSSNYVLDETMTLIRMRLGIGAAEKWYAIISGSPRCTTTWITPECCDMAVRWFFGWRDQSFSFTDCTSFIVMREMGIEDALTGDGHFVKAGFQIHP